MAPDYLLARGFTRAARFATSRPTVPMCGRGGIGRRATLRSLWAKARGSSSLLDRTITRTYTPCGAPSRIAGTASGVDPDRSAWTAKQVPGGASWRFYTEFGTANAACAFCNLRVIACQPAFDAGIRIAPNAFIPRQRLPVMTQLRKSLPGPASWRECRPRISCFQYASAREARMRPVHRGCRSRS